MSFYQSWSIAPTKSRPHPGALGESSWADSVDWGSIIQASIETLPSVVAAATSQATAQAQQAGASPAQLVALQAQIAATAANRKRLQEEAAKQKQREQDIKTRNLLILSGIGVVGLIGAILILK